MHADHHGMLRAGRGRSRPAQAAARVQAVSSDRINDFVWKSHARSEEYAMKETLEASRAHAAESNRVQAREQPLALFFPSRFSCRQPRVSSWRFLLP